jgi:hypothetical protein
MSSIKSRSRAAQQEDFEMRDSEEDNNSGAVVLSDYSLRNLYQVGHNSKNLTKTLVTSLKFREVIENIKVYVANNQLSLRSLGPIILGLVKLYDRQIKFYLEELSESLKLRKNENEGGNIKNQKSKSKSKIKDSSNINNSTDESEILSSKNSFYNKNVLSLSPLQDGIFSLLNKELPSSGGKFLNTPTRNYENTPSVGIMRADGTGEKSKSKFNFLNSNDVILEKTIFEEENQDINNFFKFINEAAVSDNKFDMENLNFANNFEDEVNKLDILNPVFKSNNKSLLNNLAAEISSHVLKSKEELKKSGKNTKIEYDEEIEISFPQNQIVDINSDELFKNFKERLVINNHIDNLNKLFKNNNLELSNLNQSSRENLNKLLDARDETISDIGFLGSFNSLDLRDFGNNFEEKLNQIAEEIKNEKKEDIYNNFNQMDDNHELEKFDLNHNEEFEKPENNNNEDFKNNLMKIIKKKEITFSKLINRKEFNIPPHETFYNLLILAQNQSINIDQNEIFNADSIVIAKN